jgi:hypothetical protein
VLNLLGIPGVRQPSFRRVLPASERIAAVSDTEILARAIGRKHNVAFFAIDGALSPATCTRGAIESIAEATFGVVKGSARVSLEKAALSLAFDPRRVAFGAIQKILDGKLAGLRLSLLPIRIVDERQDAARSVRTRTDAAGNRR